MLRVCLLGFLTAFCTAANAAYVGSLAFVTPSGTVGPSDEVPIWVRLTLDASSDPLIVTTDAGSSPPFGVPLTNYPSLASFLSPQLQGQGLSYETESVDISQIYLNTSFGCTTTFSNGCSPGAYTFSFNTSGPDSINFLPDGATPSVSVAAGGSRDYLFGYFRPTGGNPVDPGTYYFYTTTLLLQFVGTGTYRIIDGYDQDGYPIYQPDPVVADAYGQIELASTPCGFGSDPSCPGAFSRTVVPLPGAGWLAAAAMLAMAPRLRRRR